MQTVLNSQRDELLALMEAGREYEFLNAAFAYLNQCPDDPYVRLMAIRGLLALHLVLPARELASSDLGEIDCSPAMRSLRSSLAEMKGDMLPWSDVAGQFESNLTALADRGFDVTPIREEWNRRQVDFQLFRDRNQEFQVRRKRMGHWGWTPSLDAHEAREEKTPLPDDIRIHTPGPYLFEGLGRGRFFERIYRATLNTFLGYGCPLYVLAADVCSLAVTLHLNRWETLLADPRVLVFTGRRSAHALISTLREDVDLPWPSHAYALEGAQAGESKAVTLLREAGAARDQEIRASLAELEKRYSSRTRLDWARRYDSALSGRGEPLRILCAVSTHTTFLQHSMRDARRALESLGHRVLLLTEDRPFTVIGPLTYHRAIREFNPDLFLLIDHLRPGCGSMLPAGLPLLTWDQDQLPQVFTRENLARIAPHDFIVGCSKFHCVRLGCNPRQVLNARVPTCPEQFGGEPLTDEERQRYECDVSFVSHASQTPREFHDQERSAYGEGAVVRLIDAMYELLPAQLARYRVVDGGVMAVVFEEACRRVGIVQVADELRSRLCGWYLWRLGDRMFRHEALQWVAHWAVKTGRTFRIYGNGWNRHPTLAAFSAGPAQNGRELLCVYRASRVNLQLMPAGFIHQRSLDGLAAGGFFLGRYVPDDLRGKTLRALIARIHALGLRDSQSLLDQGDPELRRMLREYVGDRLGQVDPYRGDLFTHLHVSGELAYPDEVLPNFSAILFDSADEFASLADRFLADHSARQAIAQRMREAVIKHYSYRSTMQRFLRAMTDYLSLTNL